MKALLLLPCLLATGLTAAAQTPITLTQSNFPALPTTVELYNTASITGVMAPTVGANQTWNYSNLTATGQTTATYNAPSATPAFAGTTRTYNYTLPLGSFQVKGVESQALTATGLTYLGYTIPTQRFGLGTLTGAATDSLVVPMQSVAVGATLMAFPTTTGTVTKNFYRSGTTGLLTVGLVALNKTPLRLVQRVSSTDSVAGYGTLRVPVAGGASASQVLLVRSRVVEVDSFYLAGQPAPAVLLGALGVTQGTVTRSYYDNFYRAGSSQPVAGFTYTSASYQTLQSAFYSRESTLLATRPSLAAAVGGLSAYPNPLAQGPLVLAAGNGSRAAVALSVRDVLGRQLVAGSGTLGQPTALLSGLPQGNYLLEITAADGQRAVQRITVQ
ncbi:T9SS type A sorting domain-containing protein [Hymenobacter sp. BRD128]|uniref:T9SS type A sorting domain-containing protein n=1 Tax=Hymenobacter sp. BRD128 TaxID=2675878 RepID=UPI0015670DFB|nr:T9SS type A sorting domain-containing protein [Hymenobacter sp. BRD128]QKG58671.1 T9SS type A sorting domain-containing protein [Hymenobacter sp. BRD128]